VDEFVFAIEFNGRPCSLYVLSASEKNPRGRFQVIPKGTSTPIITRANLADLLPLKLVRMRVDDVIDDGPAADEASLTVFRARREGEPTERRAGGTMSDDRVGQDVGHGPGIRRSRRR
jgi:hypothetical protein